MSALPMLRRDFARPLKAALLAGSHANIRRVIYVNLDHCMLAAALGLLVGWWLWG
jgi:hypothetical protein